MSGLADAVARRLGFDPDAPVPTSAERDRAQAEAMRAKAATLVDDPFIPGAKVMPSMQYTHPANRKAAAVNAKMAADLAPAPTVKAPGVATWDSATGAWVPVVD